MAIPMAMLAQTAIAQTDVTDKYIQFADFSSSEGWTEYVAEQWSNVAIGKIGELTVNSVASTTDDTHTADQYCAGVSARWEGNYAAYQQTSKVTLPAGLYTLSYDVENPNGSSAYDMESLFYVAVGETTYYDEDATAANFALASAKAWTAHAIDFEVSDANAITISLGYKNIQNVGSSTTPELFISNLKLVGYTYAEKCAELVAEAKAIDQSTLNTGVAGILASAISEGESASTGDAYKTAIANLQSAISLANNSVSAVAAANAQIAACEDVLNNSTADDKTTFEAAINDAKTALAAATTVDGINAAVEQLEAARQTYVLVAVPNDGYSFDYTFAIEGVGNSKDGWTADITSGSIQNFVYKSSSEKNTDSFVKTGFIEAWNGSSYTAKISYTKTDLRNGHYKISAYAFTTVDGTVSFFANDKSVALDNTTNMYTQPVIDDVVVTNGTLTFGLDVQSSNWNGITNIELQYLSSLKAEDLGEIGQSLQEQLDIAMDIDDSKLSAGVKKVLTDAIAQADAALANPTEDALTAATEALKVAIKLANESGDAIAAANEAIANCQDVLDNSTATDKTTFETAIKTAQTDLDAATSLEAIEAIVATLETARQDYMKTAEPNSGYTFDYTFAITNPSFETGDFTGWEYFKGNDTRIAVGNEGGTYGTEGVDGTYLFNTWSSSSQNFYIQQTVTLPAGKYVLSALVASDEGNVVTLSANENETAVTTSVKTLFTEGELTFWLTEDTTVVIKAASSSWFKADNFTLARMNANSITTEEADALLAAVPEGDMAAAVQSELTAAKAALEADKTSTEAYQALAAAITKANISITANPTIVKMQDLLSKTNVYTAEAKATFDEWITKYEEATLTSEEAASLQTTIFNTAWHGSNEVDDLLMSAWDENTENWDSYHTNTWSTEGDSDGSEYKVPFIEYWTSDAGTLAAKTMTATLTGQEPNGNYQISAWVRVRTSDSATDAPTGITLQLGDGDEVDVCAGDNLNGSQYYLGTFVAKGMADAEGNLTIKFIVADGCNANWLAFKDLMVSSDATAINSVGAAAANADGIYTLTGVKVGNSLNGLQRGVYIVNGKKVVKK